MKPDENGYGDPVECQRCAFYGAQRYQGWGRYACEGCGVVHVDYEQTELSL